MISANIYTPKIEKTRFMRVSRALILIIAGKLSAKVIMVLFNAPLVLKKKNMRRILKDLITVV